MSISESYSRINNEYCVLADKFTVYRFYDSKAKKNDEVMKYQEGVLLKHINELIKKIEETCTNFELLITYLKCKYGESTEIDAERTSNVSRNSVVPDDCSIKSINSLETPVKDVKRVSEKSTRKVELSDEDDDFIYVSDDDFSTQTHSQMSVDVNNTTTVSPSTLIREFRSKNVNPNRITEKRFPKLPIKNGSKKTLLFSCGDSPCNFWLINPNSVVTNNIKLQIARKVKEGTLTSLNSALEIGDYRIFKSNDTYFRGLVIGIPCEGFTHGVQCLDIDTGKYLYIDKSWYLDDEIYGIEAQAVHCKLADFSFDERNSAGLLVKNRKAFTAFSEGELNVTFKSISGVKPVYCYNVEITKMHEGILINLSLFISDLILWERNNSDCRLIEDNDPLQEINGDIPVNEVMTSNCIDEVFTCCISSASSPDDFHIQILNDDIQQLDVIQEEMSKYYSSNRVNFSSKSHAKTLCSVSCAAKFLEDDMWYRGKIIDWFEENENFVKVYYVDYGNTSNLVLSDIQPLLNKFSILSQFSVKCKLSGIQPVNSTWCSGCIEEMKMLCSVNRPQSVVVKSINQNTLSVCMYEVDTGLAINDSLVHKGYAIGEGIQFDVDSWNQMESDFEKYRNCDYDDENPCMAVSGYVPQDEKRICKFYLQNRQCYRGKACKFLHVKPDPDGWTLDKCEVYTKPFNALEFPNVGSVVPVSLQNVTNSKTFYAVIPDTTYQGERLRSLQDYINLTSNVRELKPLSVWPADGQLIIAKYSIDKKWYRASVVDSDSENNSIHVFQIDFGRYDVISSNDIRTIEPKFLHLPGQTFNLVLANAEILDISTSFIDFCNKYLLHKLFRAKVVAKCEGLTHPTLYTKLQQCKDEQKDVGELLIEHGFAVSQVNGPLGSNQIIPG